MNIVHMLRNGKIKVIDLPELELYDNFVVVKIISSTICGVYRDSIQDFL
ncbi:MAG: hypothetical protein ACFFG0_50670 [Candidatus Thorarchaeota archaeon]